MFQWLKNLVGKRDLQAPGGFPLWSSASYDLLAGGRSASSGVPVNRETVHAIPAVWRGVNLIANKIAKLPLQVIKIKNGANVVDEDHPTNHLLAHRPSDLYTPFTWKSVTLHHALLHGNAYSYIFRDELGRPQDISILRPEVTFPVLDNGDLLYVTRINGQDRKLLPSNVIHIKGLSWDGIVGYSVIDVLRDALGLSLAQQRYASVFFRNNAAPGPVIIKLPTFLKDKEAREQFRSQWAKVHEGLDRSHRVALLEGGSDLVKFEFDHEKMQLIQGREFELISIANILGIPPHKIGSKINVSYASLESEERSFLNDSLSSWLTNIEEELEFKLLKESEKVRNSHSIEFDTRELVRATHKEEIDTDIQELSNGGLSLNEYLAKHNREDIGPDGDRRRMPSNLTFIDLQPEEGDTDQGDEQQPVEENPEPVADGEPDKGKPISADEQETTPEEK